jgi:hypothetical protein
LQREKCEEKLGIEKRLDRIKKERLLEKQDQYWKAQATI